MKTFTWKTHHSAWVLTTAIFLALLLPAVIQKGLFMDGAIYASVARNLSIGDGTFWKLHFSQTLLHNFYDHPPLAFGLQSIVFKMLGDHFFVERLYNLFFAIMTAVLIALIYFSLTKNKRMTWLPVLLWISTERVFWCFNQNMLESTMSFFSLLSIYFLLKTLNAELRKKIIFQALAALALCCAFLSKGLPGLFPLGFYMFYFAATLQHSKLKSSLIDSIRLLLIFGVFVLLFFTLVPEAFTSVKAYLQHQVLNSVQGRDRVGERWPFISGFVQQVLPMLVLVVLAGLWRLYRKKLKVNLNEIEKFLFLISFSAFLPLLVSPKLSFYYFVPAIPYFALSTALYLQLSFADAVSQKRPVLEKVFQGSSLILLAVVLLYSGSQYGRYQRDENLLKDIDQLKNIIPEQTQIGLSPAMREDWQAIAYFQRIGHWSVSDPDSAVQFNLSQKSEEIKNQSEQALGRQLSELRLNLSEKRQ